MQNFSCIIWCGFLVWLFGVTFWSFLLFSTITHHKGKCNHDPEFFKKILCLLHVSDPNSGDIEVTSGFEFFCICSDRLTWLAWLRQLLETLKKNADFFEMQGFLLIYQKDLSKENLCFQVKLSTENSDKIGRNTEGIKPRISSVCGTS